MKLQEFLNDLCFQLYVSQKQCLCGAILNKQVSDRIIQKSREASAESRSLSSTSTRSSTDSVLEHYSHPQGWLVEGFDIRQWLFITCLECHLSWSLDKLGVPQSTIQPLGSR